MSIFMMIVYGLVAVVLFALLMGCFIAVLVVWCMVVGSDIDPDDNGLLKSPEEKEKWRQAKLKKLYGEESENDCE